MLVWFLISVIFFKLYFRLQKLEIEPLEPRQGRHETQRAKCCAHVVSNLNLNNSSPISNRGGGPLPISSGCLGFGPHFVEIHQTLQFGSKTPNPESHFLSACFLTTWEGGVIAPTPSQPVWVRGVNLSQRTRPQLRLKTDTKTKDWRRIPVLKAED